MKTLKFCLLIALLAVLISCQKKKNYQLDKNILVALGAKHRNGLTAQIEDYKAKIASDSTNIYNYLGVSETNIILYAFGFKPREQTIPEAKHMLKKAFVLDSLDSNVQKIAGILSFIDRDWNAAEQSFKKSIKVDSTNLGARHWYTLYLMAIKRIDEGLAQSDLVAEMDHTGDYLIARSSVFYFIQDYEKMKPLMFKAIEKDSTIPWAYDWLGMAYNGLEAHEDALETYFKSFELSDGTVEVGGGLGHALGEAGEYEIAKEMANYYNEAAKTNYLPACQRAFIHLGIGENDKALDLLEQAYDEESWFLLFMQIEHWYDPIRNDKRFQDILKKMNFPE
tara:strand:- start:163 stop:1173 length:1011 start_codon:yes stop_codon:yes gene_type:complete